MSRLKGRRKTKSARLAAMVGNAQFEFFNKYGRMPKDSDRAEVFSIAVNLSSRNINV